MRARKKKGKKFVEKRENSNKNRSTKN